MSTVDTAFILKPLLDYHLSHWTLLPLDIFCPPTNISGCPASWKSGVLKPTLPRIGRPLVFPPVSRRGWVGWDGYHRLRAFLRIDWESLPLLLGRPTVQRDDLGEQYIRSLGARGGGRSRETVSRSRMYMVLAPLQRWTQANLAQT